MSIHLLSPGLSSVSVGGGGTSLFRAMAALIANHTRVFSYERVAVDTAWRHDKVTVRPWDDPSHAVAEILSAVRPGDTVIKVSGALPGRWDMIADIEMAHLRINSNRVTLIYVDVDAPSRLPILNYSGSYLDTVLPAVDKVILFSGGARAVHFYRSATYAPILQFTMAIAWYGVLDSDSSDEEYNFDIAAVFGGDEKRCLRVGRTCRALARAGFTVALAGPSNEEPSAGITNIGVVDGHKLSALISGSRFSLSLQREDVSGFSDTHPCRILESARLRSMLISDVFPGLARLVVPERDLIPINSDLEILSRTLRAFSEPARRTVTQRVYSQVSAIAAKEADTFIDAVQACLA